MFPPIPSLKGDDLKKYLPGNGPSRGSFLSTLVALTKFFSGAIYQTIQGIISR